MAYFSRWPLPPFQPIGPVIQGGYWTDEGEWDDSKPFVVGPPPAESHLLIDDGGEFEIDESGGKLII